MSSTFGSIRQASSALSAASYGLDVVSQNISNSNTPGYVRRVAQQASIEPVAGVSRIYATGSTQGGVVDTATTRMNDPVIDARARAEHARGAATDTSATRLSTIEQVFPEPSDNGLSEQLSTFWNSWSGVANDPGNTAPRAVLLQNASTVAGTLNSMSSTMSDISSSVADTLTQTAGSMTSTASQLATLNTQIAVAASSGTDTNGLLDRRDTLLSTITQALGGTVTTHPNGTVDVSVDGQSLVSGATAATVAFSGTGLSVGGNAVALSSGSASADVTTLTTTIPGYQAQLDAVANSLMTAVNSTQAGGYTVAGAAGQPVFSGTGAADITVTMTNPSGIAASKTPGGNLDGSNALTAAGLGKGTSSPDASYVTLVGNIAGASALAAQQQTTQQAVTSSVDALQASASGVSEDEELSNMLTYQHAYGAASRVLTTIDSMLDTLINHTGLVGQA